MWHHVFVKTIEVLNVGDENCGRFFSSKLSENVIMNTNLSSMYRTINDILHVCSVLYSDRANAGLRPLVFNCVVCDTGYGYPYLIKHYVRDAIKLPQILRDAMAMGSLYDNSGCGTTYRVNCFLFFRWIDGRKRWFRDYPAGP